VLNDVLLGTITDAEYAATQQRVFRDGRVAGEQLLNLGNVAMRLISRLIVLIPFLLFWTAIALYLTAPDSVVSVLLEAQKADSAVLATAARMLFQWVCVLAASALIIMAASGIDVGVRDCFSAGVHRELRRHFKAPAMGEMRLTLQPSDCGCRAD
jgi:Na+/proline symporter